MLVAGIQAWSSYLHNAVDRDVPEQGLAVRKPQAMLAEPVRIFV